MRQFTLIFKHCVSWQIMKIIEQNKNTPIIIIVVAAPLEVLPSEVIPSEVILSEIIPSDLNLQNSYLQIYTFIIFTFRSYTFQRYNFQKLQLWKVVLWKHTIGSFSEITSLPLKVIPSEFRFRIVLYRSYNYNFLRFGFRRYNF